MALPLEFQQKKYMDNLQKRYSRTPNTRGSRRVTAGKMYTFKYQAKVAEYWDKYPVSIIIDVQPKYFLGLSIHYLPPKARELFIQGLIMHNYKRLKNGQNAQISYADLLAAKNIFYAQGIFLIRKYLKRHVRSQMQEIPWREWIPAVSSQGNGRWMNITANKVWAEYKQRLAGMYTGKKMDIKKAKGNKKRITKYKEIRGYNKEKNRKNINRNRG